MTATGKSPKDSFLIILEALQGVKGDKESAYRTGQVNITPANIGALLVDGNAVSATKATQDGKGNNIENTYVKKTGGKVITHMAV